MFRTILRQVRQYKAAALLTPLWTTLEVVMGVLIPYVTASIIDKGIGAGSLPDVYRYGAMMIGIACLSLLFGILAGRFAAYSSTGLAANLRLAMYENIQRFSFSDIDKFSTAGLVTRMTSAPPTTMMLALPRRSRLKASIMPWVEEAHALTVP